MNIDKFGRHLTVGVTHQTSTDKFGRHVSSSRTDGLDYHYQPSSLPPLTSEGNYDFEDKRLCNVKLPIDGTDGATKGYVDNTLRQISPSASNTVALVRDLATLKIKVDSLSSATSFTENQLNNINKTVTSMKELYDEHDLKINQVIDLERKLQFELDLVDDKRKGTETLLKKTIAELEVKINKKIEQRTATSITSS